MCAAAEVTFFFLFVPQRLVRSKTPVPNLVQIKITKTFRGRLLCMANGREIRRII